MANLLEKIGLKKKKPILRETILTCKDLVHLDRKLDDLFLARNSRLYWVREYFSKINPLNPKVTLKHIDKIPKAVLEVFQPYGELRNSYT